MTSTPNLPTNPTRPAVLRAIGPLDQTWVPASDGICPSGESKLEADG